MSLITVGCLYMDGLDKHLTKEKQLRVGLRRAYNKLEASKGKCYEMARITLSCFKAENPVLRL